MRALFALIVAFLLLLPMVTLAQNAAPMPLPRPQHLLTNSDGPPPPPQQAQPATEQPPTTEQQPSTEAENAVTATQDLAQPSAPPVGPEQPVTLSARISAEGPVIPSGLIWRVYSTQTDENGQLVLVARADAATARLNLPSGDYVVHVAYGRSQISETLQVVTGTNSKQIILDAGALKLHSSVVGDFNIQPNQVRFDIFTSSSDGERIPVVLDVLQDDMVHLNAGVYNVLSRWGSINATVRADLRVEPGLVTEATLYHKAAQVTLRLASEAGGEAIADVEWTLQDSTGFTIYSASGAFPVTILSEGDYLVIAKRGANVYNREFQVQAGAPREIEVLTAVY